MEGPLLPAAPLCAPAPQAAPGLLSAPFCIQLTGGHKTTRNKLVYLALCDLKDNYSCSD